MLFLFIIFKIQISILFRISYFGIRIFKSFFCVLTTWKISVSASKLLQRIVKKGG
jgi:hypothetical protein